MNYDDKTPKMKPSLANGCLRNTSTSSPTGTHSRTKPPRNPCWESNEIYLVTLVMEQAKEHPELDEDEVLRSDSWEYGDGLTSSQGSRPELPTSFDRKLPALTIPRTLWAHRWRNAIQGDLPPAVSRCVVNWGVWCCGCKSLGYKSDIILCCHQISCRHFGICWQLLISYCHHS